MNIYAIRDRLIEYYLQPFAGPGDKEVLASISQMINGGNEHAIAQAPHDYEVWRLGKVDDEGHIQADREYLASCASLVRPGVRAAALARAAGNASLAAPERGGSGTPGETGRQPSPDQRPPQEPTQAKTSPRAEIAPGSGRLD